MRTGIRLKLLLILAVMITNLLSGCSAESDSGFDSKQQIGVISREEGSGTRTAFVRSFGIAEERAGEFYDRTTQRAIVTNSTAVMMMTVSLDKYAIGYTSLGTLNNTVRALTIDGAEPTAENIRNGSYKFFRSLSIAVPEIVSAETADFISFIMSSDGQHIAELSGYAAVGESHPYTGGIAEGKITVSGSSSVAPVMEVLREAYIARNPGVRVEIQQSDSSTGAADTIAGICDIGMISRELTPAEKRQGIYSEVIALDGIAVIVNHKNTVTGLTGEQVRKIFSGETEVWRDAAG